MRVLLGKAMKSSTESFESLAMTLVLFSKKSTQVPYKRQSWTFISFSTLPLQHFLIRTTSSVYEILNFSA